MIDRITATALIGYLRLTTVPPPAGPVAREPFLAGLKAQKTIAMWRTAATQIIGITPLQAAAIPTRDQVFQRILDACPFFQ